MVPPIPDVFYQTASGERRKVPVLTEDQINAIAERAARKVAEELSASLIEPVATLAAQKLTADFYQLVGKTAVQKALTLIGVAVFAFWLLAVAKGWIKP